jgi:hypothetical protein
MILHELAAKLISRRVGRGTDGPMVTRCAVILAAILGGCAATYETVGDPFVSPGKFNFLRCEDIAKRLVDAQSRERELRALMDRANNGTGGSAVNLLVYAPDLEAVESELRLLRRTAGEKRCGEAATKTPKVEIAPLH